MNLGIITPRFEACLLAIGGSSLLLPGAAWAGWGDENWGEMVWTQSPALVPSLSTEGLAVLAFLVAIVPIALATRRRRLRAKS